MKVCSFFWNPFGLIVQKVKKLKDFCLLSLKNNTQRKNSNIQFILSIHKFVELNKKIQNYLDKCETPHDVKQKRETSAFNIARSKVLFFQAVEPTEPSEGQRAT